MKHPGPIASMPPPRQTTELHECHAHGSYPVCKNNWIVSLEQNYNMVPLYLRENVVVSLNYVNPKYYSPYYGDPNKVLLINIGKPVNPK